MAILINFMMILLIVVSNGQSNKTDSTSKKPNKTPNNIRKIIIDSDGGVNDAFALIWALDAFNNKLFTIEALTTVKTDITPYDAFRNVIHMVNITKRSKMRKKILSIPIGKPVEKQETENENENEEHASVNDDVGDGLFGFSDIFMKYPDLLSPQKKTMAAYETASFSDDLLIETILKYPNEISLITTGPLTNLYAAEVKHAGILSLVKDIYVLGGEFLNRTGNSKGYALSEYNFNYDSNALYNIFNKQNARLPNIFIFPLDATNTLKFGLQHISLLYTLLNNDIQTEIEMCRMKMEKDADKYSGDDDSGYDDTDLYESDRDTSTDEFDQDDFQCTQTGLMYIFYEKMMEEGLRENYLNGFSDSLLIQDAAIIGYLLYPHLYEFKYVNCKINQQNGMIWYDDSLRMITNQTITIPNCFVNLNVDMERLVHGFTRDSVNMMHGIYLDYMEYMMNQMDW